MDEIFNIKCLTCKGEVKNNQKWSNIFYCCKSCKLKDQKKSNKK
jgi:endogenous inhibitor of DNA gyrase (YacG/DUF329 family)